MTGYIYRIWNDVNDKSYIGKTINSIERRFKEHCSEANSERAKNRPLYKAINKYGIEHFHIQLVEECDESILAEREIYWIETFHSYSNGYNATFGGDGKILYNHDEMVALYEQGFTCKDISEKIGCSVDIVYNAIRRTGLDTHINAYKKNSNAVRATFSDNTQKDFESGLQAAEWLLEQGYTTAKDIRGIISNISRVAKGKQHRKSYLGIKWSYIDD